MDEQEIIQRIHSLYPDAQIDINGEGCDFELYIICEAFKGISLLKRQQSILQLFGEELKANRLHALSIKAKTAAEIQQSSSHLVQLQIP